MNISIEKLKFSLENFIFFFSRTLTRNYRIKFKWIHASNFPFHRFGYWKNFLLQVTQRRHRSHENSSNHHSREGKTKKIAQKRLIKSERCRRPYVVRGTGQGWPSERGCGHSALRSTRSRSARLSTNRILIADVSLPGHPDRTPGSRLPRGDQTSRCHRGGRQLDTTHGLRRSVGRLRQSFRRG